VKGKTLQQEIHLSTHTVRSHVGYHVYAYWFTCS